MNIPLLDLKAQFQPLRAELMAAVQTVCDEQGFILGPRVVAFEESLAQYVGARYAIGCASGSDALLLSLMAMGVGQGDEVITVPFTFFATAGAVSRLGAKPVFVDIQPDTFNLDPTQLERAVTSRTKAIIPVHLFGQCADMPAINQVAKAKRLPVIEDACQAIGAGQGGQRAGVLGDTACFSFFPSKNLGGFGDGGMVTTNDPDLWSAMWAYKDHGKSWDAVYNREHPPGFRWVHDSFGTNWRMLEVQAAVGRIQLRHMTEWTAARTRNAQRFVDMLQRHADVVRVPTPDPSMTHAYYRLYAYVRAEGLREGWSRDRIVAEVTARGVPLLHGSCSEIYLEKAFDNTPWRPLQRLPVARDLGETSLMFLTHPTLTDDDLSRTCDAVDDVLSLATA